MAMVMVVVMAIAGFLSGIHGANLLRSEWTQWCPTASHDVRLRSMSRKNKTTT